MLSSVPLDEKFEPLFSYPRFNFLLALIYWEPIDLCLRSRLRALAPSPYTHQNNSSQCFYVATKASQYSVKISHGRKLCYDTWLDDYTTKNRVLRDKVLGVLPDCEESSFQSRISIQGMCAVCNQTHRENNIAH